MFHLFTQDLIYTLTLNCTEMLSYNALFNWYIKIDDSIHDDVIKW